MKIKLFIIISIIIIPLSYWWVNLNTLRTPTIEKVYSEWALRFDAFKADVGRYPSTEEGIRSLYECPPGLEGKWKGYFSGQYVEIKDRWGRPLVYRSPGIHNKESYDVFSLGKDGVVSEDDVGNWKR